MTRMSWQPGSIFLEIINETRRGGVSGWNRVNPMPLVWVDADIRYRVCVCVHELRLISFLISTSLHSVLMVGWWGVVNYRYIFSQDRVLKSWNLFAVNSVCICVLVRSYQSTMPPVCRGDVKGNLLLLIYCHIINIVFFFHSYKTNWILPDNVVSIFQVINWFI